MQKCMKCKLKEHVFQIKLYKIQSFFFVSRRNLIENESGTKDQVFNKNKKTALISK